jgi:hypothetical protein
MAAKDHEIAVKAKAFFEAVAAYKAPATSTTQVSIFSLSGKVQRN